MLINLILLFFAVGFAKKSKSRYSIVLPIGVCKGVLYFMASQSILAALAGFIIFGGLAAGLVYFLAQLDKKEATEDPYPKYGTRKRNSFKWEYIPLSGIVFFLIFGEMTASMLA